MLIFYLSFSLIQISVYSLITYVPPIISQINPIIFPNSIYGNISKIRVNQKYIVRYSNTFRVDIWSNIDYSLIANLKAQSSPFNSDAGIQFLDFCLQPTDQNMIGLLTINSLIMFNISNNQILARINKINTNDLWQRIIITKSFYLITKDNINNILPQYIQIINKNTTYIPFNFITIPQYSTLVQGEKCQSIQNDQVFIYRNQFMKLYSFKCNSTNCQILFLKPGFTNIFSASSRVTFSKDCSLFYVQLDNTQKSSVYQISSTLYKQYFLFNQIFSHTRLDDKNIFSFFVLTNNSLVIYLNNFLNSNSANFVISYNISFNINSSQRFQMFNNFYFVAKNNAIHIINFDCGFLKYKISNNLCATCSQLCGSCNKITGECITCINSSFIVLNGQCIPFQQQKQKQVSMLEIQSKIVEFTIPIYIQAIGYITIGFSLLKTPLFSYFFLYLLNFWSILSIYALLDIRISNYLKIILEKIYEMVNKNIFDILNGFIQIKAFFQTFTQNCLQQRMIPYYNENFGLSSKFIQSNFQQLILLGFSYYIIFQIFLIKKYFLKKDSYLDKKINFSYLVVCLQILSTSIFGFCIVFCILVSETHYIIFQQKLNILLTTITIYISLILPFYQFVSFKKIIKYQEKSMKSNRIIEYWIKKKKNKLQNKFVANSKIKKIFFSHQIFNLSQKIQMLYLVLCNVILPIFISLSIKYKQFEVFFFIIMFLFYFFGIYSANLKQKLRVNYIILNSYYLIFHFGYFIMWLFEKIIILNDQQLNHNIINICSFICLIVLISGAIHEILLIFLQIFTFIFIQIKDSIVSKNKIVCKQEIQKKLSEKSHKFIQYSKISNLKDYKFKINKINQNNDHNSENNFKIKNKIKNQQIKNHINFLQDNAFVFKRFKNIQIQTQNSFFQNHNNKENNKTFIPITNNKLQDKTLHKNYFKTIKKIKLTKKNHLKTMLHKHVNQ